MASLGQILAKLGRGEELSYAEARQLEGMSARLDALVGGQLGSTPGQPKLDSIHARSAKFDIYPHVVSGYSTVALQAAANGTWTTVEWTNYDTIFGWDKMEFGIRREPPDLPPTRFWIDVRPPGAVYHVAGQISFASNATGRREVWINTNSVASHKLCVVNAVSGAATVLPFSFYFHPFGWGGEDAIWAEILVWQDSGAPLNLHTDASTFAMARVR